MSRKIEDLTQETQQKFAEFKERMDTAGIDFIVTATLRTHEEQEKLYAQGRTAPGKIVTWTLNSKHLGGTAFDIVIMSNGKPDWDISNQGWLKAGQIADSIGLEWGGFWKKSPDYPHIQLKETANA